MLNLLCCKNSYDLPTVKELDINKYAGKWYEIARLPNRFEKGLKCVSATYILKENNKIEVVNKGYSENKNKFKDIKGTAWTPDSNFPGRLKVRFFWPFAGDYYIIALDDNYSYALVGDPSRKFLWILSKTKKLDDKTYDELLGTAKTNGFRVERMTKTNQDCI